MKLQAGGKQEKITLIQQEIKEVMKGVARWWTREWQMGCTAGSAIAYCSRLFHPFCYMTSFRSKIFLYNKI